jgi:hypothetical protein
MEYSKEISKVSTNFANGDVLHGTEAKESLHLRRPQSNIKSNIGQQPAKPLTDMLVSL